MIPVFDFSLTLSEARHLVLKITDQIESHHKDLLVKHPLKQYLSLLDNLPVLGGYHCVSGEIEMFCKNIVGDHGVTGLALYHKLVLATLIVKAEDRLKSMAITEDVVGLFYQNFSRILKLIDIHPPGFFQHSNDKFSKDLSVCLLRLMPMGAQKIILSGVPRMALLKAGGLAGAGSFSYMLSEAGGFKPFYEMHTDEHDSTSLREFSASGWDCCYLKIAAMLELNKDVKGVFAISWFFDPQLERISPRLNFLRERPLHNGGRIFFLAKDKEGVSGALVRSATRQKLFETGEYVPATYLMVWPRKHLIRWANNMRKI